MADRGWMYSGWKRGKSTDEWYVNTKEFLDLAFSKPNVVENGKIKCPCADCRNYVRKNRDDVELDLCFFGFKRNYTVWKEHGEGRVRTTNHVFAEVGEIDRMDNMVADLAACEPRVEEQPIESAKAFYRMVENVKELVHENTTHSTMTGSSSSIENPKAKKRLDDYYDGLKEVYPEDWQERDLDPKVIYSSGGGLPHGRLAICDSAIKKSEVRAIAKQHNIRPANSLSYQDLVRRNQQLEKKCKTVDVVAKHLKLLYAQSGLPVPGDLEDALMGDTDLGVSSPSNQGGTPPTGSSHAGGCSNTPQSRGLNATPAHSPNDVDGAA